MPTGLCERLCSKMKCPHCESTNIQSHVIIEDKESRNLKIVLGVILLCIGIPSIISLLGGDTNLLGSILIGLIVATPICLVLKIVLKIIPARKKTVFVCNECGAEFKQNEAD